MGHSGGRLAERAGPIHAPEPDVATSPDARDAQRHAAKRDNTQSTAEATVRER
jgi:hypothetical protein